jgi:hypothetical protein
VENFKAIIRQHLVKNHPVIVNDITIAEKIFGLYTGTLKGKSNRKPPIPVKQDLIVIPPELKDSHLDILFCMDFMLVNGTPMLTGMYRYIRFRALIALEDRNEKPIYKGIDSISRLYNEAGFRICDICCDQEFRTMLDKVSDKLSIEMN